MKNVRIIQPDDWHVHFRDGKMLNLVVPETDKIFGKCIVMPNLIPPITSNEQAQNYKKKILDNISNNLKIFLTIYLTENLKKNDLERAFLDKNIFAVKYYPQGATTNSSFGINKISKIFHILETMEKYKIPLLIHGEDVDPEVDIYDREKSFIDKILVEIIKRFPNLKITLEHITTEDAVKFILQSKNNIAASITPHHLSSDRNSMLVGGIKPHLYCLPILKRKYHKKALLTVATSGNKKFFLGTDSAPHQKQDKESSCGCAGIFNTKYSLQILTQIFDKENSLNNLEKFTSINGCNHYGLPINQNYLHLVKRDKPIKFSKILKKNHIEIVNYEPDFPVYWDIVWD